MGWTARDRVLAAVEHREPDRVPVDLTPTQDFYLKLKAYLGIEVEEQLNPSNFGEVIPHPAVLQQLGVDLISVKLASPAKKEPPRTSGELVFDAWGVGWQRIEHQSGSYLEAMYHPLEDATLDDLKRYHWPDPAELADGERTAEAAKRLFEDTDLALVGRFGGPIVEICIYLMGFQSWLTTLAARPEEADFLLNKITSIQMELDRAGLEAAGKYLTIYKASGDDLGMQTGLLYSPRMIRTQILPYFARRWQAARQYLDRVNPRAQIMFHCCGSIREILPDLIAAGAQIIDPVQPRAARMDLKELKQEFGARLTFHGGLDEQQILPFGTVEEVRCEARACIHALAPGGGYILTSSHFVQSDTPPENVVAMCRAANEYGCYPIS
jgi:uroporphyrinogen decarboxylase